ncbi:MAG TPA: ADP-forming succinate--CoA ligase subunit beta, partial [Symbiobacteriaceae bacterium]|nr:ADP-forming succinate--CoA ligase subunit beta [Symbiobacteriaceae bacterium]
DLVSEAIIQVKKSKGISVPLVVRMVGTNDVRGRELLAENGIEAYTEMGEAARAVVKAAYGKEA